MAAGEAELLMRELLSNGISDDYRKSKTNVNIALSNIRKELENGIFNHLDHLILTASKVEESKTDLDGIRGKLQGAQQKLLALEEIANDILRLKVSTTAKTTENQLLQSQESLNPATASSSSSAAATTSSINYASCQSTIRWLNESYVFLDVMIYEGRLREATNLVLKARDQKAKLFVELTKISQQQQLQPQQQSTVNLNSRRSNLLFPDHVSVTSGGGGSHAASGMTIMNYDDKSSGGGGQHPNQHLLPTTKHFDRYPGFPILQQVRGESSSNTAATDIPNAVDLDDDDIFTLGNGDLSAKHQSTATVGYNNSKKTIPEKSVEAVQRIEMMCQERLIPKLVRSLLLALGDPLQNKSDAMVVNNQQDALGGGGGAIYSKDDPLDLLVQLGERKTACDSFLQGQTRLLDATVQNSLSNPLLQDPVKLVQRIIREIYERCTFCCTRFLDIHIKEEKAEKASTTTTTKARRNSATSRQQQQLPVIATTTRNNPYSVLLHAWIATEPCRRIVEIVKRFVTPTITLRNSGGEFDTSDLDMLRSEWQNLGSYFLSMQELDSSLSKKLKISLSFKLVCDIRVWLSGMIVDLFQRLDTRHSLTPYDEERSSLLYFEHLAIILRDFLNPLCNLANSSSSKKRQDEGETEFSNHLLDILQPVVHHCVTNSLNQFYKKHSALEVEFHKSFAPRLRELYERLFISNNNGGGVNGNNNNNGIMIPLPLII